MDVLRLAMESKSENGRLKSTNTKIAGSKYFGIGGDLIRSRSKMSRNISNGSSNDTLLLMTLKSVLFNMSVRVFNEK